MPTCSAGKYNLYKYIFAKNLCIMLLDYVPRLFLRILLKSYKCGCRDSKKISSLLFNFSITSFIFYIKAMKLDLLTVLSRYSRKQIRQRRLNRKLK